MVLSIGGGPERNTVAKALGAYLARHPEVAWVETGFGEKSVQGFYELYFDRRFYLASDDPDDEIPVFFEEAALSRSADELRSRLGQFATPGSSRRAAQDPLGLFERILGRVRASQPALTGPDGNFVSLDGAYAIVLLELRSSPFDSERQKPLLRDIDAEFARLNSLYNDQLVLEQSGINRVSVATERGVRANISFVSTLSITMVCGLFLLFFRSFRQLAIVIMAPAAGFLTALGLALSIPDPLHGITLAFGFVLIGVAIDYPIHLINHHALAPEGRSVRESVRKIRPSLILSAITTTLAFLALALSEFPGLREMGIFAAVGIPTALALTLYGLPSFLSEKSPPTSTQASLARRFDHIVKSLSRRGTLLAISGAGIIVVLAWGLPQLRWGDDPSDLMTPDPQYLAESERVRARVSAFDGGKFVVGRAASREGALALNDEIYDRLEVARKMGAIDGLNSLHTFLWSEALQQRNLAAFRQIDDREARLDRVFF